MTAKAPQKPPSGRRPKAPPPFREYLPIWETGWRAGHLAGLRAALDVLQTRTRPSEKRLVDAIQKLIDEEEGIK